MPEVISCPDCERKLRVPDTMLGKKVKCPGCQTIFVANPAEEEEEPTPPRKSATRSSAVEPTPRRKAPAPPPDDDEDEDEDERPSRSSRPLSRKITRDDDEDEDEDDRPSRSSRGSSRKGRRDEEDEDEDEDEDYRDEEAQAGWGKVRLGLTLVIVSIFMMIGFAILQVLIQWLFMGSAGNTMGNAFAAQMQQGPAGPAGPNQAAVKAINSVTTGFILMIVIFKLMNLASSGMNLTGHALNLAVPERRGVNLKLLSIITASSLAFALVCVLITDIYVLASWGWLGLGFGAFMSLFSGGFSLLMVLSALTFLGWATSWVTFVLTLRGTCLAFNDKGVAKQVMLWLIVAGSMFAFFLLVFLVLFAIGGMSVISAINAGPGAKPNDAAAAGLLGSMLFGCIFGCLGIVSYLGMLVWYIIVLFQVRGVVDKAIRGR